MGKDYLLFESASGYSLFERLESEVIGEQSDAAQASIEDITRFSKIVQFKAFVPFISAENALENQMDISEGIVNDLLKNFLEKELKIKSGKKSKVSLGVQEEKLAGSLVAFGIACKRDSTVLELIRGIRMHFSKFIKDLAGGAIEQAMLGLGHRYSRAKVKFNVNKVDNMIIQSISLLDQLDKDLNTFAMRCREWYSWHFPELVKVVPDNIKFARLAKVIQNKSEWNDEKKKRVEEVLDHDTELAQDVIDAAKASMGTEIADIDMATIESFANRVIDLALYKEKLYEYLQRKMSTVAPNLTALIGEQVGARLIAHAGSLTSLSKYPASTVQILGAEKALFRALKTKGNTPKYGTIYHSTFIGRASVKNKGRISRYLANKSSMAARIDSFSDVTTNKFGLKYKEQVEDRLRFYNDGVAPKKNVDAMKEVLAELQDEGIISSSENIEKKKKKSKKGTKDAESKETTKKSKKRESKKKSKTEKPKKKRTHSEMESAADSTTEPPKKKAKKSKDKKKKTKK